MRVRVPLARRAASMTAVPSGFLPGYLLYLAAVLIPGYGLGELFGRWRPGETFVERFGYVIGYGICADTVVFAVKTLGIRVGGIVLLGLTPSVLYFLIALGLGGFVVSYLRRGRVAGLPAFDRTDLGVVIMAGVMGAAALLYFAKYPIFPYYSDIDFLVHTAESTRLIAGTLATVPKMVLYGAASYQISAAMLAVGGVGLITAQRSMAIVVVLSPFLVFAVSSTIFRSRRAALLVVVIYALGGTIWSPMVFVSGLYSNFVGVLLELLLVAAFLSLSSDVRSPLTWGSSMLVLVASYFSHYTVITVLGSFVVMSAILAIGRRGNYKGYLLTTAAFLAPGIAGAVLYRRLLTVILAISYNSGKSPSLTTYLSNLLIAVPSVSFLAVDINNDLGFVAMVALLGVAVYKGYKSRFLPLVLPLVWFFALLAVAPQDHAAWRFSFEAVLPLMLISGYGLHMLIPQSRAKKTVRAKRGDTYRIGVILVVLLFIMPILANGWTAAMTLDSVASPNSQASVQGEVYQSMVWMGEHMNSSAYAISVTDPGFIYARNVAGVNVTFQYFSQESQAIQHATQVGAGYLIVTRYDVHYTQDVSVPDDSSPSLPWFTFQPSPQLRLVYNNTDVEIFQLSS